MPLARTRPPVRPTVRLRPVPPLDPPFDDECVPETWVDPAPSPRVVRNGVERFRPAAAESRHPGAATRPATVPKAPARPVERAVASAVRSDHGDGGRPPLAAAVAGATPEAKQAAKRFLDTCLEIVNGYRPAWHVRALASPPDAAGMVAQLASATSRVSGRSRPGQPVRTVRLRRLRVCEPRPGVVEAAAAVGVAGRTWAMAFRIERRRGSWVGTAVALL
ncbi:Rv3235 family protein [Plantactinospora sp. B6F1]|uniref:Rv3235 family protein n=1 Tax=Plantactinospora sp. B6F1 TaxID=3158971 RepID=UPI0032D939F6